MPISEHWRKKLIALGCPKDKLFVHRMGVDLNKFGFITTTQLNEKLSNTKKQLKLFSVCRFTEKKGLEYAIASLRYLVPGVDVVYTIAGYGELEGSLKQKVVELNLASNVRFIGPLSSQQVIEQMQQADVVMVPSVTAKDGDMEGLPVTIMEAMAIGTLVLSTYHSAIPELVEHQVNGYLVPEREAGAIATQLTNIWHQSPERTTEIIQNARKRVEQMSDNLRLTEDLIAHIAKR